MWVPAPFLTHTTVLIVDQHSFSATYLTHSLAAFGCKTVGPFDSHAALSAWLVCDRERPSVAIIALDWVDGLSEEVFATLGREGIPYILVDNAPWRHLSSLQPTFSWPYGSFQILEALQNALKQTVDALSSTTDRQDI